MVAVRVQAQIIEVSAKTPPPVRVVRQAAEVAVEDDGSGGTVRVQRHVVEVSGKAPARVRVVRQAAEAAVEDDGSGGTVRVQWQQLEVSAKVAPAVRVVRQAVEVVVEDDAASNGTVRVQRQIIEVSARRGVAAPDPLSLPARLQGFLHNWADAMDVETAYLTDVTTSPVTGAESRLGLRERPMRNVRAKWLRSSQDEMAALTTWLRRITDERLAAPLYPDAVLVNANSASGQPNIYCDARYRRFFNGGRVAVFPVERTWLRTSDIRTHSVAAVYEDRLQLTGNLSQTYGTKQWIVVPLIDVERQLQPSILYHTAHVAETAMDLQEVHGKSALPPSYTGSFPPGWQLGPGNLPIFELGPDWSSGVRATFRRPGDVRQQGRTTVVVPQGPRALQVQEYPFLLERPDWWRLLQFFDSRRGRLGVFWEVDREWIWRVSDTDPDAIDVSPRGSFTDFVAHLTPHVGIVMRDGTVHIREVDDVQVALGSWHITLLGDPLPAIDVAQIDRFSRARVKRFDSDALLEHWETTQVVRVGLSTVEVLSEGEVEV